MVYIDTFYVNMFILERTTYIKFTIFRLSQNVDIDGVVYALLIA